MGQEESEDKMTSQMFSEWLDKNCDEKVRLRAKIPMDNGKYYECDKWNFVIEDHEDGETPALMIVVGNEPRTDYMDVEIQSFNEDGSKLCQIGLGLFDRIESLETLIKVLVKENR